MRIFAILVLLLGAGLAGGAVFVMYGKFKEMELRASRAPKVRTIPLVKIAVAGKQLKYGEPITAEAVRLVDWPKNAAPENSFDTIDKLFVDGAKVRTVLRRMEPNEPILTSKVSGFGERATVAALLDSGMLAYTFSVDAVTSAGGFMLPGTRIDVILTVADNIQGLKTYFLMQNIEVVAVDQDTDKDRIQARIARTVTVQVTPTQVKELTLARNLGKISLALRGFNSTELASNAPINRQSLLGDEVEAEPEAAPVVENKVRVRKGGGAAEAVVVE